MFHNKEITSPLQLQNNWFINLTNINFPPNIQGLIQLGNNFCFPVTNSDKHIYYDFIKRIESTISKLNQNTKAQIRNHTTAILTNWHNSSQPLNNIDTQLLTTLIETKSFLKNKPEIILTRADKGNVTVAIYRTDYNQKMQSLLEDTNTYTTVTKNPINKIITNLNQHLNNWLKRGYITRQQYLHMHTNDGILPRAYGLPKIHKPNVPLRIIVSSLDTPLYNISSFLHSILHHSLPTGEYSIKDSFSLVNKLQNKSIPPGFSLISLDVISLFTNIPIDLVVSSIEYRWNLIALKTNIPHMEFIKVLKFILESTYFTFDNTIYRQTFGCPMGSPLSPIIAEI
ncbi:PREDICTED: uncharacterized protein LOC105555909, partial [Vollenhovia emeryi]|uniref:uncharacterized protein LOC105555909 n=1 Tax=Vollenhovia emeryi TaxID=411798 RepID=UPI0005F58325